MVSITLLIICHFKQMIYSLFIDFWDIHELEHRLYARNVCSRILIRFCRQIDKYVFYHLEIIPNSIVRCSLLDLTAPLQIPSDHAEF